MRVENLTRKDLKTLTKSQLIELILSLSDNSDDNEQKGQKNRLRLLKTQIYRRQKI